MGAAGSSPKYRLNFPDVAATALCAVGILAGGSVLLKLLGGPPADTPIARQLEMIRLVALEAGAILCAVYFVILRRRGVALRDLGFEPIPRRWVSRAILIALVLIPVVGWVVAGVQAVFDRPPFTRHTDVMAPPGFSWIGAATVFLYAGILGPFAEELLFRGILYRWLRDRWNVVGAALVSALLFALPHGFLEVIASGFVVGMVLALVYEYSRTLWAPVILHIVFNSATLAIMFFVLTAKGG